ncbi:uncharacterized protein IWZ02DRAFT_451028 [Phyllosticta citriasiana]|uniref:uncharacterized protein n=1 Tax=Phyllosticta citriasiana TaxID=595635 RepID=UPI0030FD424A
MLYLMPVLLLLHSLCTDLTRLLGPWSHLRTSSRIALHRNSRNPTNQPRPPGSVTYPILRPFALDEYDAWHCHTRLALPCPALPSAKQSASHNN